MFSVFSKLWEQVSAFTSPLSRPSSKGSVRRSRRLIASVCVITAIFVTWSHTVVVQDAETGLASYALKAPAVHKFLPHWLDFGFDRHRQVIELRVLQALLDERYRANDWQISRKFNGPALERLAHCIETRTCGPREEELVILASLHFGEAFRGGTSGETIWALSTLEALRSLNYTLIYTFGHMDTLMVHQAIPRRVKVIILDTPWFERCLARNETNYTDFEAEETQSPGYWQTGDAKGCVKRAGFEDGIPVWKMFAWHFWRGAKSPLGGRWTLSPSDYTVYGEGDENLFVGYSVQTKCEELPFLPAAERDHQSVILGKQVGYYHEEEGFTWAGMLEPLRRNITTRSGQPFQLVGTAAMSEGDQFPEAGVENVGRLTREGWMDLLSHSKAMLGIGRPLLSPSPFDALCFGVPFINPIFSWDTREPDNRAKWRTQHDGLRFIDPPYVYHAKHDDAEELQEAMWQAVTTPISRYIPHQLTREEVRKRHLYLVEHDWEAEARKVVQEQYTLKDIDVSRLF